LQRTSASKEAKNSTTSLILNFNSSNLMENLAFSRKGSRRIRIFKRSENNSIPEGMILIKEIMHLSGVNQIRKPFKSHSSIIRIRRYKVVVNISRAWPREALKLKCQTCITRLRRID
jgi:hypothetical protein